VEVNVPGVMAMLVAPLVAQLSVLLDPEVMLVGLAVKELITGLLAVFTVTVSIDVVEPAALVAVRVYLVVAVGLMLVAPLADVDVNVPGVMAMLVTPAAAQLSVLLLPEFMLVGSAVKEVIVGMDPFPEVAPDEVDTPQAANPAQATIVRTSEQRASPEELSPGELRLFPRNELVESMGKPRKLSLLPTLS
jgi:hypothetical protein